MLARILLIIAIVLSFAALLAAVAMIDPGLWSKCRAHGHDILYCLKAVML